MSSGNITKKKQQKHHPQLQQQNQLQISQFIKDPTTLKLLILAGTNIKSTQLFTVSKCLNLIKLDLSSNNLSDFPINFSLFSQLKILYLHDNNIFQIKIQNTNIQYLSLFNNSIKEYRERIIQKNGKIIALDYNVVTKRERLKKNKGKFSNFTVIKWPIVETNMSLENQEDYLNLLKAQIFVITNLYKKAISAENIQSYLKSFSHYKNYRKMQLDMSDQMKIKKYYVLEAVQTWKKFKLKNQKLKKFLKQKGKQHLLYNNLDLRKQKRSPKINAIIQRFVQSIRQRMAARKVLQKGLRNYRNYIPISQKFIKIIQLYKQTQQNKLYFFKQQIHYLQKIFLYAKRLLFNKKSYDLCDNFEKLVTKEKKQYYIYRSKQKSLRIQQNSFLLNSIRQSINLVLGQKDLDRKHFLYTRKGHKKIGLKNRNKLKLNQKQIKDMRNKIDKTSLTINKKYQDYQILITYSIKNRTLFELLMRLLRYFNSGNSSTILSNQAAYFQTQVIFQLQEQVKKKQKIFVGLQFFMKRIIAANIIQKFWRRINSNKKSQINVIKTIKQKRASKMISNWLRNLVFNFRIIVNKNLSFLKTLQKTNQMYIQLDIYMRFPIPTNILANKRYGHLLQESTQIFYKAIHTNTYVQIIQLCDRKWVRIIFPSAKQVYYAQKLFVILTFKFYYNGFHLKFFNYFEAQQDNILTQYQQKVKHLFKIDVKKSIKIQNTNQIAQKSKKLIIQNYNPYFIWAQLGQKGLQHKFNTQKKSLPISIFIYNKYQKPLKINCDFNWINPSSIYHNKNIISKTTSLHTTNFRTRTPTKKFSMIQSQKSTLILPDQIRNHYFNKLRSQQKRDRRNSQIAPHHTSLLRKHREKNRGASEHIQINLLSQTLNIRKK